MNIYPFDERVVIEIKEQEEKKVGGIILPESAKEKPQLGVVSAVGTGEEIKKMVKKGDKVIFNKFSGTEFSYGGDEFIVLDKDDVLAKVEE
ncbi:MAG: co-chaperone GroES [Deltaproteobacteria bacterium]|nr:co-chaperone GroES [Deltaproteobacteria bacterium]